MLIRNILSKNSHLQIFSDEDQSAIAKLDLAVFFFFIKKNNNYHKKSDQSLTNLASKSS